MSIIEKIDYRMFESICEKYDVLAVYLYGSQLSGKTDKYSDLDLGILFHQSREDDISTAEFFMDFKAEISEVIEFAKLDINFLQNNSLKTKFKVITTGEVIYSADDELRLSYEDKIICQGLDFNVEMRLYYDELKSLAKRGDLVGR